MAEVRTYLVLFPWHKNCIKRTFSLSLLCEEESEEPCCVRGDAIDPSRTLGARVRVTRGLVAALGLCVCAAAWSEGCAQRGFGRNARCALRCSARPGAPTRPGPTGWAQVQESEVRSGWLEESSVWAARSARNIRETDDKLTECPA